MGIELLPMSFQGKQLRIIIREGEPFFNAKDLCEQLDLSNVSQALSRLDQEDIISNDTLTEGGLQTMKYVSESGMYSLVLSSKTEDAKKVKKWITHDVIPSIRKTGAYSVKSKMELPTTYIEALKALVISEEEKELALKKLSIISHTKKTYTASEMAKELGMKSAQQFNKWFIPYQYKTNGTRMLRAQYCGKGYDDISSGVSLNGHSYYNLEFTQMGREWILKLYADENISSGFLK